MELTVFVYRLEENMQYGSPKAYTFKDKIKVGIYENLDIDFNSLSL